MTEIGLSGRVSVIGILAFEFVSEFGFWISDLAIRISKLLSPYVDSSGRFPPRV
jgi:hypothetical protein